MISSPRTCILLLIAFALPIKPATAEDKSPLVLAHYMPWYVAKPTSKVWGWHWTMNHFDPEKLTDERREIASHFYPTIGPYDSGDPHVIEYHLLTMKLAGIDGVIVDWYGLTALYDYAILHRNTTKLIEQAERFGMKFIICYEDQTIPALVKAKRIKKSDRVAHTVREIKWLDDNWFKLTGYVRVRKQPALLSFGHAGLKDEEWAECLQSLKRPISYFSEHYKRDQALGMYDWPIPSKGIAATTNFNRKLKKVSYAIPVAYPRFVDIYKQAKVNDGYDVIKDNNGRTLKQTLNAALETRRNIIQIATWNDWGEGTQIEPSIEHGYRDLEVLQKRLNPKGKPSDLRLPKRLLDLRRSGADSKELDSIARSLSHGRLAEAKTRMSD